MAAISTLITTAIAAAGVGVQVKASRDQKKAQDKADSIRRRKANLEAARERRRLLRESQIARAQTLNLGANQGAQFSSGLQGGVQNVTNQTAFGLQGVQQGQDLGAEQFAVNGQINKAQALGSIGGALVSNAGTIGRVFGGIGRTQ